MLMIKAFPLLPMVGMRMWTASALSVENVTPGNYVVGVYREDGSDSFLKSATLGGSKETLVLA